MQDPRRFSYICLKRGSHAGQSVKSTKTRTASKNTLENKQIMCRLYRGQTTVRGRIHLLRRATACKVGRTCRFYRLFCPMSVPKSHGRRTQPTRRDVCGTHIVLWFVVKASKSVPGAKWTVAVPCARHEETNRPRLPAPPPPHTLPNSFFIYIQQFSWHHLPAPDTSANKNSSYMIAFPNRKINKYLLRGTTYFKIQVNNANFPLLFRPSSTGCSTSSMNDFEAGRRRAFNNLGEGIFR